MSSAYLLCQQLSSSTFQFSNYGKTIICCFTGEGRGGQEIGLMGFGQFFIFIYVLSLVCSGLHSQSGAAADTPPPKSSSKKARKTKLGDKKEKKDDKKKKKRGSSHALTFHVTFSIPQ